MRSKLFYVAASFCAGFLTWYALAGLSKPPGNRLTLHEAEEIALATYEGQVESHELEKEKGTWVYSFDLRGKDNRLHEVLIDARTGNVVSHVIETPQQEAKEAAADKGKRRLQ